MTLKFSETLSDVDRRRAKLNAYASAWFGCVSEVMMDTSAILIIFMTMMHGNDFMAMMTTTVSGICSMLFLIPCALIIPHWGLKPSVKYACLTGCAGYLLMASAPFFGETLAKYVILLGVFVYAFERPLYSAAWYPLLDQFLRPQDRGNFFGFLRFSYNLISGSFMFLLGLLIGKTPPVWLLQVAIAVTGILVLGRWYFISKFPIDPNTKAESVNVKRAFLKTLSNGHLTSYSVYLCLINLAYTAIYPLTLIYLKSYVHVSPGTVQIISSIAVAGSVTGYLCYGKLLKLTSLRALELTAHFAFIAIAFLLFFCGKDTPGFICLISVLVYSLMFFNSIFYCCNSVEVMALAQPGNKLMATSYCQSYGVFGTAIGRTSSSLLVGSALLAPVWTTASGIEFSNYQTIFLVSGVLLVFLLVLLPVMPSVVPKRRDYYDPPKRKVK